MSAVGTERLVNKMKKIIMSILAAACLFSQTAYAGSINYGESMTSNMLFLHYNDPGYSAGYSEDITHSPGKSYYVDYTSAVGNTAVKLNRHVKIDPRYNVYVEGYIKGIDKDYSPSNSSVIVAGCDLYDADGNYKGFEKSFLKSEYEESGWVKVYGIFSSEAYDAGNITFGFGWTRTAANADAYGMLYFDDFKAVCVPKSIKINDVTAENMLDLNDLRVIGIDNYGTARDISAKDMVKYTVIGGDAYIDENNVVHNGSDAAQTVEIKADFLSLECSFYVKFGKGNETVEFSEPTEENGRYSITVNNKTSGERKIIFAVCIFENGRMRSVKPFEYTAQKGESVWQSENIEIPYYVRTPEIKIIKIY